MSSTEELVDIDKQIEQQTVALSEAEELLWLAHKHFGDSKSIRSGERGSSDRQQAQNRIYRWLDKRRSARSNAALIA